MKKRFLALMIVAIIPFSMIGCGNSNKTVKNDKKIEQSNKEEKNENKMEFDNIGIAFNKPEGFNEMKENQGIVDIMATGEGNDGICGTVVGTYASSRGIKEMQDFSKENESKLADDKKLTKEEEQKSIEEYSKKMGEVFKPLFEIVAVEKDKVKKETLDELKVKYNNSEKVGEQKNIEYYLMFGAKDESLKGLNNEEKKEYEEYLAKVSEIKSSIKTIDIVTVKDEMDKIKSSNIVEFNSKDVKGNEVSSDMFKDYKLTMIDIWGTECGPCVSEMPELEELYKELKNEKINLIGIVNNAKDEETTKVAKEILEKKGVSYTNIVPDEKLEKGILKDVVGTPTILFINDKGEIVGDPIIGGRGKDEYKKIISEVLK